MGCASTVEVRRPDTLHTSRTLENESIYLFNRKKHSKIAENLSFIKTTKNSRDVSYLIQVLSRHFILHALPHNLLLQVIQKMIYAYLPSQEPLLTKHDTATSFLVLDKGLIKLDSLILGSGSTFGELAVLNGAKQKNLTAIEDSYFWVLDRESFAETVEHVMNRQQQSNLAQLKNLKFYQLFTLHQQETLSNKVFQAKYQINHPIVHEGESADCFSIILSGQATAFRENKPIKQLNPLDSFGENCLLRNTRRKATIKAISEVVCLVLPKGKLKEVFAQDVQLEINRAVLRHSLQKFNFEPVYLEKLIKQFQFKHFTENSALSSEELVGLFVVVVEGQFVCSNRQYNKFDTVGHIIPGLEVTCNGSIAFIEQNSINYRRKREEELEEFRFERMEPQFHHLTDWTYLGNTNYGSVHSVSYKGQLLIVRKTTKEIINHLGLDKQFKQERKVLELLEHPFISNFHTFYSQENQMYFLQEFAAGKLLTTFMHEQGLLPKERAEFIVGQMVLLLEYLSKVNVVCRAIKPDSFIIDDLQYIKLIDFKTAKKIGKTCTMMGTPHYMAPELIEGKGCSGLSDVWSLGVIMYELLCGGLPYGEDLEDPYMIYEEIMNCRLKFPHFYVDRNGRQLISQLLSLNPYQRIGPSFNTLKAHEWFEIDWQRLYKKEIKRECRKPVKSYKRQLQLLERG